MKSTPSFQFYPSDWLSSQRVQLFSLEEEGAYIRLLCYCWTHGKIPSDPEKIARIIGKGASTTLATTLSTMFQPDGENGGWLVNPRLEREKAKQRSWREKSSEGGRKSAEKRQKAKGGSTTVPRVVEVCLENGCNQNATLQSSSSTSVSKKGDPIPDSLMATPFIEAWERWKRYRKEIGKSLKDSTAESQLKKFQGWGVAKSVAAINRSIENGWQGIFEPDHESLHSIPAESHIQQPAHKLDMSRAEEWFEIAYPEKTWRGWQLLDTDQKNEYRRWLKSQQEVVA